MADDRRDTEGAPPRSIHVEQDKGKKSWLPWLLAALALAALLFALSRCDAGDDEPAPVAPAPVNEPIAQPVTTSTAAAIAGVSALAGYLSGTEPVPRTFTFEQVEFATGSSTVREADAAEIRSVADTLKQHSNARVRLVGYADARGNSGANASLGKARADSVKAALVSNGIDAASIETSSGGEADPADTNATSEGRSENRRTELVVLQR